MIPWSLALPPKVCLDGGFGVWKSAGRGGFDGLGGAGVLSRG